MSISPFRIIAADHTGITVSNLERSLEYEDQPPDAAWNAVEVFKKK